MLFFQSSCSGVSRVCVLELYCLKGFFLILERSSFSMSFQGIPEASVRILSGL